MGPAAIEIAKLILGAYFSFAKLQGATDEDLEALYKTEKDEFDSNNPSDLEDV